MSKIFVPPKKASKSIDIDSELLSRHVLKGDGTSSPIADISWKNHKIVNLGTASDDGDAVNKAYADELLANFNVNLKDVKVTEEKDFSGVVLKNIGEAVADTDAVNKAYTDGLLANLNVNLKDVKVTEEKDFSGVVLKNIGEAVADTDAVNKKVLLETLDKKIGGISLRLTSVETKLDQILTIVTSLVKDNTESQ